MFAPGAPADGERHRPDPNPRAGRAEPGSPDRRLPRARRIVSSKAFREAFENGSPYRGRLMLMFLRQGPDAALRLGAVAGKRTLRRAADRNRARRLLREAYRMNRYRFHGTCDIVLVARQRIAAASLREVERELRHLARRAGIMAEDDAE